MSQAPFKLLGGPCDGWMVAQDGDTFEHTEMTLDGGEAVYSYERIADTTTMMHTGTVIR